MTLRQLFVATGLVFLWLSVLVTPVLANNLDTELLSYSKSHDESQWKYSNDAARRVLSSGANVNAKEGGGYTPLMHASWFGNMELVKILLSNKADINLEAYDQTALTMAITRKHKRVVEFLIKNGANINSGSVLLEAVKTDQIELTQLLLSKGANANIGKKNQITPLGAAAFYGFARQASVLLKHKATVDVKQGDGLTPLMFTARGGFAETARYSCCVWENRYSGSKREPIGKSSGYHRY